MRCHRVVTRDVSSILAMPPSPAPKAKQASALARVEICRSNLAWARRRAAEAEGAVRDAERVLADAEREIAPDPKTLALMTRIGIAFDSATRGVFVTELEKTDPALAAALKRELASNPIEEKKK